MQQHGTWKPYNVKALVRNVELVFKSGSIERLNEPTYKFITLHMGFIAHYNLHGFQAVYQDLRDFCQKLQMSEYSYNRDDTLMRAIRYEQRTEYGEAYNKSIAQAIRGVVEVARTSEQAITASFGQQEKERELAVAKSILTKYGFNLPKELKKELMVEKTT
ncbi:MAG: hypothetical protein BroJett011_77090 [Chloroflexota bacterium]|nr:MAG: hypothetical protein BroJett011_77090 [Chloroflexota bacterium]